MKQNITLSIAEDLLMKLKEIAASKHRSVSQQVEKWITEKLKEAE